MKHIKLFEDYSDEELKDLMGDLKGVGHSNLIFNVDLSKSEGNNEKIKQECEDWTSEVNPGVHVTKAEGHIINKNDPEDIYLNLELSNGDKIEFKFNDFGSSNTIRYLGRISILTKGKEIADFVEDEMFEYPGGWILSALTLYDELIKR